MELVEDDGGDPLEKRIVVQATKEHAFGADEQSRAGRGTTLEADAVADLFAELRAALFRDACGGGAGRDPPRLQQDDLLGGPLLRDEAGVENRRRDAGRFAGTGRSF